MSQGKVIVNNLNLGQGSFPEIERKALFIGGGTDNLETLVSLNSQTDLDLVLGSDTSNIKTQVKAAQLNGGENWEAYAYPIDPTQDWTILITDIIEQLSVELIVACNPVGTTEAVQSAHDMAESIRTTYAKRMIVLQAITGFDEGSETEWDDYIDTLSGLLSTISGYRVAAVPLLHDNDLGCLAGRLCNRSVSIADSPMRVATGPILGLGEAKRDTNGDTIRDELLTTLDQERFTVIQRYVDYPGTFFGSCTLLDEPAGDYQVIENLRVVDKAARAIRILAIKKIKDRSINTTPLSQEFTKNYLMRPLREMAKSAVIAGIPFPGEIKPPKDEDIVLSWSNNERLEVYLKVTPYESPREIIANIILDLSLTSNETSEEVELK